MPEGVCWFWGGEIPSCPVVSRVWAMTVYLTTTPGQTLQKDMNPVEHGKYESKFD